VTISAAPDRRAALKARHRAAILSAADELIEERGGPRFSVDELAERADVARRTVFNHFASLDDVMLTLCDELLAVLVDDFIAIAAATPVGDGSRASMFDEIASAIRSADLVPAIARMVTILGTDHIRHDTDPREDSLTHEAFARVGDQVRREVARRNPGADDLDVALLVGSLVNGIIIVAKYWVSRTDARVDDDTRAVWNGLLDRLLTSVRTGYLPES
jgi:AcrR family transcriptional regulator